MTRLTNELESVYVEERRDALDKLQAEHIEELRALTNRYTANEEELRQEVSKTVKNNFKLEWYLSALDWRTDAESGAEERRLSGAARTFR